MSPIKKSQDMKKIYVACCTMTYNGSIEVEAETDEMAYATARQKLKEVVYPEDIDGFDFSELEIDCLVMDENKES